jgi:hypothetical protein
LTDEEASRVTQALGRALYASTFAGGKRWEDQPENVRRLWEKKALKVVEAFERVRTETLPGVKVSL